MKRIMTRAYGPVLFKVDLMYACNTKIDHIINNVIYYKHFIYIYNVAHLVAFAAENENLPMYLAASKIS